MKTESKVFSNLQRKTSVHKIFTFYKIKTLYLEDISYQGNIYILLRYRSPYAKWSTLSYMVLLLV